MSKICFLGDDCLRLNIEDFDPKHVIADQLRNSSHWMEVVVGKQDISVQFDPIKLRPQQALRILQEEYQAVDLEAAPIGKIVDIPVSIAQTDAPDLTRVAQMLNQSPQAIWDRLTSIVFDIDMLGFTPGFAYLTGTPDDWLVERLKSPRQTVAAGSIGIITGQCGLYALEGPGGWPIIGRAQVPLFDASKHVSPLRYSPNDRIRFLIGESGSC